VMTIEMADEVRGAELKMRADLDHDTLLYIGGCNLTSRPDARIGAIT
jgi:hypothetical protein